MWKEGGYRSSLDDGISYRKVLGINWDVANDNFSYEFKDIISEAKRLKQTKRNLLKVAAMFYDPLGLVCPVTLQPKLFFKRLCVNKLDWDDDITPEEISQKWNNAKVLKFDINRHIHIENKGEIIELHGFADASIQAYTAAV